MYIRPHTHLGRLFHLLPPANNICLTKQVKMAITSAILAITSAKHSNKYGNNISQKPGNKICHKIQYSHKWHNNSHSGTIGATNKQTMAITSVKHGNNICQHQKVAIMSAKHGNNICLHQKVAITSATKKWQQHLPFVNIGK